MFAFKQDMVEDLEFLSDLYYVKILRVNLKTDSYEIIKQLDSEHPLDSTLSGWLNKFAMTKVEESDRFLFLKNCSLALWLKNIAYGIIPDFMYHRCFGNHNRPVELIVMPSVNFSEELPVCYLFVKEII